MTEPDVRAEWEALRDQIDADAWASKMSEAALIELSDAYSRIPAANRGPVNAVIVDWLTSSDEAKRYDAVALIAEHRISSALPALHRLAEALETETTPGAPYERAKVLRVIHQLAGNAAE